MAKIKTEVDYKEELRILKEQNTTLSEAHLRVLRKATMYEDALTSINERTGGILNRISGAALRAGNRLITEIEEGDV